MLYNIFITKTNTIHRREKMCNLCERAKEMATEAGHFQPLLKSNLIADIRDIFHESVEQIVDAMFSVNGERPETRVEIRQSVGYIGNRGRFTIIYEPVNDEEMAEVDAV